MPADESNSCYGDNDVSYTAILLEILKLKSDEVWILLMFIRALRCPNIADGCNFVR